MDSFLSKVFNNAPQAPPGEEPIVQLLKRCLGGNTAEIDPHFLYAIHSHCNSPENANRVMHALTDIIDEFCEHPLPIFKALKLIIYLIKMSAQTFVPAAQAFAPEIQTIVNVSFDKPGAPHVNTIHKYANLIYLHLIARSPLPDVKIPPPPPKKPAQQPDSNLNPHHGFPSRPGAQPMGAPPPDEGSLFDRGGNDKYEDSGSFLSGMLDLGFSSKKRQSQGQNQGQIPGQPQGRIANLPEADRPRVPAVFAGGGIGQYKSRIQQPADLNMGEESLLNFDDFNDDVTPKNQTQPQKNSQGGLFGAFDDISFTDNNEKPTEFVFSGDDNANANDLSFNPFGETSFNPTFPNPSASNQGNDNFDEIDNRPKQTPMRLRPSGPRPKFDPNKMKKKKVVANTVPQGDFDPFGTGNASAAFANIQSTEEPKKYVSLAERFGGASQQQQQGSNDQKQQPKQTTSGGGNVFDLLGISGSEDEDDTPQQNIQLNSNSNTQPVKPQPNQQQQIQQKGSHDLFDMLGDDAIVDSSPSANNSTSQAQQGSGNLFESFTTPQQTQPKAQQQQPKQNSANVFDMLDGDVFGGEPKQNETPKQQSNAVFEPFGAVSPNSSNKPKDSSNMFDSFTPSFQPQQQSPQPQQGSGNVFDMLDASPAPPSKQQGNSNDLFESFAAPAQPQKPQQQPQKASRDVFDMLGDFGQPNTAPSQPQQQKSANVFDMLDDFNPPQQPQGSGNAFVSPPVQQPQQQQQGQSGARNVFDFL